MKTTQKTQDVSPLENAREFDCETHCVIIELLENGNLTIQQNDSSGELVRFELIPTSLKNLNNDRTLACFEYTPS